MPEQKDLQQNASTEENEHPKLVLHFDIRNTMIVADSVTNISVEQALNAYLTGVLWGREIGDNQWQWISKEPALLAPDRVSLVLALFRAYFVLLIHKILIWWY